MKLLVLVSLGGAIGASLRYLVYQLFLGLTVTPGAPVFPWATLVINVLGSLLMGVVMVTVLERLGGSPEVRAFVATGILGGFTTFSAFSLDAVELYLNRTPALAAAYIGGSVVLSIAGLVAGMALTRWALT